jgi:hypothetical protein
MALTRKTFQAVVCIDATSDGLKVCHAHVHGRKYAIISEFRAYSNMPSEMWPVAAQMGIAAQMQMRATRGRAFCAPGPASGSKHRVLHAVPQRLDGGRCGRVCALHSRVRSAERRVDGAWNTSSCSFPLMTGVALAMIDKRQEHNSVLRFRQFGHLYDRWGVSVCLLTAIGWPSSSPTGMSRTDRSFSRSSRSLGAVGPGGHSCMQFPGSRWRRQPICSARRNLRSHRCQQL